jgi:carbamoyl-phosphate synthase small subunit
MDTRLEFFDGTKLAGKSFGHESSVAGEVVFATGMTGYPQAFTDPSFEGQILVLTYPIIGNYGVPPKELWESDRLHIKGLIVSQYIDTPSHHESQMTLAKWLQSEKIPALEIKDTRLLAQALRDSGAQLGKIIIDRDIEFYDPNQDDLLSKVTTKKVTTEGNGKKIILMLDCGAKRNIHRCFVNRGVKVINVPWT